jgi:NAD(P)H-dependent flavin oxidoreductase YrpB (nitropropane dioxygenase family)
MTAGVIGINLMVVLSDYDDLLQVSLDEGVDIVFLGSGLPLSVPDTLLPNRSKEVTAKVAIIVSSARAANLIFKYWEKNYNHVPDAVVVEGPLAGGHLGFRKEHIDNPGYALDKIIPEVISVLKPYEQSFNKNIPVIAAGGIYTGADIYKFIELGANAVQIATRFVATYECDASIEFKEAYLRCTEDDLTIIDSPVGLPGRAIKSKFLDDISVGIKKPINCPWKCLKSCDFKNVPYCICSALTNAKKGLLEEGFSFAGANAYRVNTITSVRELIKELLKEYQTAATMDKQSIL